MTDQMSDAAGGDGGMTGEEAWAELVEEIGDPDGLSALDALDFIASYSDGWQAHVASMAYMVAIGASIMEDSKTTLKENA